MNESDYRKGLKYVDVRGPWPVVVCGQVATELYGKPHTIELPDAMAVQDQILRDKITLRARNLLNR